MEANSKEIIRVNAPCHIQVKIADQVVNIDVANPHSQVLEVSVKPDAGQATWRLLKACATHSKDGVLVRGVPSRPFPFLELPRELRDHIYRYVLAARKPDSKIFMDWSEARDSVEALKKMCGRQAITILGINAQIRTEAMPISFRDKIVCFRGDFRDVLLSNMRTIGKANIEHLAMGQVQFTSNLQFLAQYVRLKSVTLHFYGSVGVRLLQCLGDLEAFKKIPDCVKITMMSSPNEVAAAVASVNSRHVVKIEHTPSRTTVQLVPSRRFRFLDLSAEFRGSIYDFLLLKPKHRHHIHNGYCIRVVTGDFGTACALRDLGAQVQAEIKEHSMENIKILIVNPHNPQIETDGLNSIGLAGRKVIEELHLEDLWHSETPFPPDFLTLLAECERLKVIRVGFHPQDFAFRYRSFRRAQKERGTRFCDMPCFAFLSQLRGP
ncbi:hypothetical protein LTS18_003857 [Coniosporium uncinatum]|uniref:Uncharacterized protein n=1 Tax=Coniosporium uncinatum TaxID=93489 RepID=A0ACC3D6N9_9PEZI|nr:hypothetical protein LTS18_003857 [Coniosporium uncinatum]